MVGSEFIPGAMWPKIVPAFVDRYDRFLYEGLSSLLPDVIKTVGINLVESREVGLTLVVLLVAYTFLKKKPWRFQLVVGLVLMLALDLFVDDWLKQYVGRIKPYLSLSFVPLHHVALSFPSSHAVNFAFIAVFLGQHRRVSLCLGSLAVLVAISRVLCARHYPLDVIGGLAVGGGMGWSLMHAQVALYKLRFWKAVFYRQSPDSGHH